jgi:cbb3-type cytochrome oxidase maturation protein
MLAIVGIFAWALHRGQFDALEGEGTRILFDESQGAAEPAPEESLHTKKER